MLNQYPISPRLRATSNPPRPYTLYRQRQLEKEKEKEKKEKQGSIDQLPESQVSENDLPPGRPPRNPARLTDPPSIDFAPRPSDETCSRESGTDWDGREAGTNSLVSPITSVSDIPRPSLTRPKSSSSKQASPQPQFSTLDRAILRELQRSMLARSSQFRLKNDKKHHPFRPDQVPYPRSYDKKSLDCDVWETVFCEQFSGSVTWHVFDLPPTKVLDLGCGTGSWILDCVRKWKDCHFVGLDIVPLHPDLGHSDLSSRITWVQANFLEPLPFPNEEFDFVHIKRIARGVPEDKWDFLFEEITRVMKPGGAFEMLEEDLYLPGRLRETTSPTPSSSTTTLESTSSASDAGTHITTPTSNPYWTSTSTPHINILQSELILPQSSVARSTSDKGSKRSPNPATISTRPSPESSRSPSVGTQSKPSSSLFNLHSLMSKIPGPPPLPPPPSSRPKGKLKGRAPSTSGFSSAAFAYPAFGASLGFSSSTSQKEKTRKIPRRPASSSGRFSSAAIDPTTSRTLSSKSSTSDNISTAGTIKPAAKSTSSFSTGVTDAILLRSVKGKEKERIRDQSSEGTRRLARARSLSHTIEGDQVPYKGQQRHDCPDLALSHSPSDSQVGKAVHVSKAGFLEHADTMMHKSESTYSVFSMGASATSLHYPTGNSRPASRSNLRETENSHLLAPLRRDMHSNDDVRVHKVASSSTMGPTSGSHRHVIHPSTSTETRAPGLRPTPPSAPPPSNPRDHRLLETIYVEMHASRFVNLEPLSLLENYLGIYFKDVRTHAPLIFTFPPVYPSSTPFDAASLESIAAARVDDIDPDRIHDAAYDHHRDSILTASSYSMEDSLPYPPPRRIPSVSDGSLLASSKRSVEIAQPRTDFTSLFTLPSFDLPSTINLPEPTTFAAAPKSKNYIVSAKQLMSGASEYVVVDRSRSSAVSPRNLLPNTARVGAGARSDNSSKVSTEESSVGGSPRMSVGDTGGSAPSNRTGGRSDFETLDRLKTGQQLNMLPNKRIEIDLRSLNLHLRARVAEVLACAESMWDWVRDFQRSENERERGRIQSRTGGSSGGMKRRGESVRHPASGKKFLEHDLMLGTTFGVPVSSMDGIGERIGEDAKDELLQMTRERFDEIMTWFQFDMDDSVALGAAIKRQFGWPSFIPQRTDERTAFELACSRWESYEVETLQTRSDRDRVNYTGVMGNGRAEERVDKGQEGHKVKHGNTEDKRSPVVPPISRTHPSNRLCRTLRVFVAWKA